MHARYSVLLLVAMVAAAGVVDMSSEEREMRLFLPETSSLSKLEQQLQGDDEEQADGCVRS